MNFGTRTSKNYMSRWEWKRQSRIASAKTEHEKLISMLSSDLSTNSENYDYDFRWSNPVLSLLFTTTYMIVTWLYMHLRFGKLRLYFLSFLFWIRNLMHFQIIENSNCTLTEFSNSINYYNMKVSRKLSVYIVSFPNILVNNH